MAPFLSRVSAASTIAIVKLVWKFNPVCVAQAMLMVIIFEIGPNLFSPKTPHNSGFECRS